MGSGKTTLLNALLRHPDMAETAVLINEFGDVGIDHLLVREVLDEAVVQLNSGCLCCSVRGELVGALRDLHLKRVKGEVPEFERVVIETTGLADPAPIVQTFMTDPLLGAYFRLDGIVATVDALLGSEQLNNHLESVKQVAVADRLVLTKSDLAPDVESLETRLKAINPSAPTLWSVLGDIAPTKLFGAGLFNPGEAVPDVARWLGIAAYADRGHSHSDGISSFCLSFDHPLPRLGFGMWIDMLLANLGERILRVKGVVQFEGEDAPVAIHGVNHVFHPPQPLPAGTNSDRTSRLVFITRDLERDVIVESLDRFLAADRGVSQPSSAARPRPEDGAS